MKFPEWTTEDREFARRVHAAAQDRVPDDLLNQWTECSGAYGPRSCPALGVLLGMVRAVWGDPELSTLGGEHTGWSCVLGSDRDVGDSVGGGATEALAMLAALEAKP